MHAEFCDENSKHTATHTKESFEQSEEVKTEKIEKKASGTSLSEYFLLAFLFFATLRFVGVHTLSCISCFRTNDLGFRFILTGVHVA